jgi:hypothetical protein
MESARGEDDGEVCLSMYTITENIYYSQLSSFAILLQPETNCLTSYSTMKGLGSVSQCDIVLRSSTPSHMSTSNGQRSSQLFCVQYLKFKHFACIRYKLPSVNDANRLLKGNILL